MCLRGTTSLSPSSSFVVEMARRPVKRSFVDTERSTSKRKVVVVDRLRSSRKRRKAVVTSVTRQEREATQKRVPPPPTVETFIPTDPENLASQGPNAGEQKRNQVRNFPKINQIGYLYLIIFYFLRRTGRVRANASVSAPSQ